MLLKRFYHEGLAQASYLVGSQQTGEAVIVDPNRALAQYAIAAEENGLRITHVTETHIHADFLSGARELAHRHGARLLLSGEGGTEWQYAFAASERATLLRDGDHFMVGDVRLDVVHTPGHTPEHLIFVVTDTSASERPLGAFTGDFIFVGDVGRPDLLERAAGVEGATRAGAKLLFESLRRFTEHFPDYLQLWPGHGAGSACGKAVGAVPQTTLGYEKLVNWAFQIDDEQRFVETVIDGLPDPPPYFGVMKRMNREGPAPVPDSETRKLPVSALRDALATSCAIDVRRAERFGERFVRGTINIPLNRGFIGYAGWIVPYDRDICLIADDTTAETARLAASELSMIGLDRVTGWFDAEVFEPADGLYSIDAIESVLPRTLAERRADHTAVIDVRTEAEWNAGHLPGSRLAPLGRLVERSADIPRETDVVLVCQSGSRSVIGASLLAAAGFRSVANLDGGVSGWESAGLPVERESAAVAV